MSEIILIKKYPNRRLYNTEKSTYISLAQLTEMIKEGRLVKVINAKTEEDVTAFILTQIVLEEAKKNNILLPVPLLHLIIQHGETVLAEFFDKYLQQTVKNYLTYKTSFDDHFKKWLDLGTDLSATAGKTMMDSPPFESFFDFFSNPKDSEEKKE